MSLSISSFGEQQFHIQLIYHLERFANFHHILAAFRLLSKLKAASLLVWPDKAAISKVQVLL